MSLYAQPNNHVIFILILHHIFIQYYYMKFICTHSQYFSYFLNFFNFFFNFSFHLHVIPWSILCQSEGDLNSYLYLFRLLSYKGWCSRNCPVLHVIHLHRWRGDKRSGLLNEVWPQSLSIPFSYSYCQSCMREILYYIEIWLLNCINLRNKS